MLTVNEVAKIFGVEEATVRDWAKKGELPARKVGRNWYFSRSIVLERQSVSDAIDLIGGNEGFSINYDLLVDDERVEIKSASLKIGKRMGKYWYFTNFHPAKLSDFYLLLGYNQERTKLLYAVKIPSIKLEKRMPIIMSRKRRYKSDEKYINDLDGHSFNINLKDKYFYQYVIYKDDELDLWMAKNLNTEKNKLVDSNRINNNGGFD